MNLRKMATVASALTLACSAVACGGDSTAADTDTGSMQVMLFPAPAYRLPVLIAQEKGFFDEVGVKVNLVSQPNNLQGAQPLEATNSQAGHCRS